MVIMVNMMLLRWNHTCAPSGDLCLDLVPDHLKDDDDGGDEVNDDDDDGDDDDDDDDDVDDDDDGTCL